MGTLTYDEITSEIRISSNQIKWFCEGISLPFSRFKINLLLIAMSHKLVNIIKTAQKMQINCSKCVETDCSFISMIDDFKYIRDCMDNVLQKKDEVLYPFLVSRIERLTEDVDNIVENFSMGTDPELVNLVSALSKKISQ
jgi:hypothetical protein